MNPIPYGRQDISQADIDAVVAVMKSDFLTQGPVVNSFEKFVSNYCGVRYGVAVNSATSALHIACLALGVGKGDFVWTSPISFVASANCAIYCNASIDFVDIDPDTLNISIEQLKKKLVLAEKNGVLPKVLIPVHLAGQSCDMASIKKLSNQYGFKIIEDASHAIGGKYKDVPIGSCSYSDICVFSFHPVKIITTCEGGMAMTNDEAIASKMLRFRSHGITRDAKEMTHLPDGPWYYQQIELGFNYRMPDIQAALGLSQMTRLDEFVERRHALAKSYNKLFENIKIKTQIQTIDNYSSFHLYIIRLPQNTFNFNRASLFERLRANGIGVNIHYIPIYRHPFYECKGFKFNDFPESEKYYSEAITLPIYPAMTENQQIEIFNVITQPFGHQTIF